MKFLKSTKDDVWTLAMDEITAFKWNLDASFAVLDITWEVILELSNTRSSTEAELVSFDDILAHMMWTKLFLDEVTVNDVFRDNHEIRD